jgi:cell division protein FtsI/penicillin-binding protein 2
MAIMCAAGLVLVGQLVRWQVLEHHHFAGLAEAEHQDELVIPPHRGEIRDRNGHLLAADIVQYDISASPKIISNPQGTADRLYRLLDIPRDELLAALTSDKVWVPLTYGASQSVGETLSEWDIVGIGDWGFKKNLLSSEAGVSEIQSKEWNIFYSTARKAILNNKLAPAR